MSSLKVKVLATFLALGLSSSAIASPVRAEPVTTSCTNVGCHSNERYASKAKIIDDFVVTTGNPRIEKVLQGSQTNLYLRIPLTFSPDQETLRDTIINIPYEFLLKDDFGYSSGVDFGLVAIDPDVSKPCVTVEYSFLVATQSVENVLNWVLDSDVYLEYSPTREIVVPSINWREILKQQSR